MQRLARQCLYVPILFFAVACSRNVTVDDWRQDLRQLERELETRHVDLFHHVKREEFAAAVNHLDRQIPSLSTPEILVGMSQLVAMVGDGHTSLWASEQKQWRFGIYPLRLWSFGDGIFVTAADDEHEHLLGKRLVKIDDTPIDEVFRLVGTTIAADNAMEHTYAVPFELIRSDLLHVLGIAGSPDLAEFTFEDGQKIVLTAMTVDDYNDLDWRSANGLYEGARPPSMRLDFLFATALTLPHLKERKYYWYTYLEDERTLFLQYNVCWDQKGRPAFAEVANELLAELDRGQVERVVVDLRQNSGGEPMIAEPLIRGLAERPEIGEEGRLFVLVGRRTYSAALTNAAHLRSRAGARIVGEPPRGKPNHPSEGRDIDLPRSGVWATVSTELVERDPSLGDAEYLPVDIPASYTLEQYRNASDPILTAALAAKIQR